MSTGRTPEARPPDGLPATEPYGQPGAPPAPSWEGRRLAGRYLLGGRLGAGGMGLVLRAHDELLHRDVAVKLLADNLAVDPHARERFLREARAAARISHPRTVAVYDVGEDDGRPYLVMELVEGASLADVLVHRGPLDPDEVASVAPDALTALASAHDAGVLHRDVKPGNLLCDGSGRAKLTDFGVAEAADVPGLTRTGLVMGTRSYLAPERRHGAGATVASDLWALGATLAELLTGSPPARADDLELPADVPLGLGVLIGRLLAEDPRDRPVDAREALGLLEGQKDQALPPERRDTTPWLEPMRRGGPISRRLLMGIATIAVTMAAWQVAGIGGESGGATDEVGGGVERSEDPAETARNLAEWLRQQGAGG